MRAPLKRLEWSVRALAQDAPIQGRLYSEGVCVADELVLEFDEHLRRAPRGSIPTHALETLAALDRAIEGCSGPEHEHVWSDEGLDVAEEWARIRVAARAALAAMGWCDEPPPTERGDVFAQEPRS